MRLPILLALLALPSCSKKDPLYCDERTPCVDPELSFCDLNGEYPASEGIKRTCIPDPFPDGGIGGDGGLGDGAAERRIIQVATGELHSCAVFNDGGARCWGTGILGYGREETIGDTGDPRSAGDVPLGGPAKQIGIGSEFTCVLYQAGNVRCWGRSDQGQLGYGNRQTVGDGGDTPSMLEDVEIGGPVDEIAVGSNHVCALLETGAVRCWGDGATGKLGYGNEFDVGDTETPASHDPVEIGGDVVSIVAGAAHTCALLPGGRVQCWGTGLNGRLGYGDPDNPNVGDDETPADVGDVNVGGAVEQIAPGGTHTCALLSGGEVRCWGQVNRLGYVEQSEDVGDDEAPASVGNLTLGGTVVEVASHAIHTCARMATDSVRCWGLGSSGQLGYGETEPVGDDETPAEAGNVKIGGMAAEISTGSSSLHGCTLLNNGDVRCWGYNTDAQLGLGHTEHIGDNETPDSQEPVQILD